MSISAVGAANFTQPALATSPASTTPDLDAPAAATKSASATPDTNANKDSTTVGQETGGSSGSTANLLKINADGTVGPMHQHRHASSHGVVHA